MRHTRTDTRRGNQTTFVKLAAAIAISSLPLAAHAQSAATYPSKPIRVVTTVAAGGTLDVVMRSVMERVGQNLGRSAIIDSQAGGTGVVGTQMVASAAPDGHTLLGTGDSLILNQAMKKLPIDIRQTLAPAARLTVSYYMWFVPASVPATNIREFLSYARANPGKINYATSGTGGIAHLGIELIKTIAGVDMVHVPYKGNGPATIDLVAGRVQMMFGAASALPFVKSGQLKLIGTLSPKRLPQFPDVPTAAESGLPGYELGNSYLIYAPIKTPQPILNRLNAEVAKVVSAPDMVARLAANSVEPAPPASPEALKKMMVAELDKWQDVVRSRNIKPDY
jgi:tripartite-type tricarboxylate transporter receptor subunit TctC